MWHFEHLRPLACTVRANDGEPAAIGRLLLLKIRAQEHRPRPSIEPEDDGQAIRCLK